MSETFVLSIEWKDLATEMKTRKEEQEVFYYSNEIRDIYAQEITKDPLGFDLPTIAEILAPQITIKEEETKSILSTLSTDQTPNLPNFLEKDKYSKNTQKLIETLIKQNLLERVICLIAVLQGEKMGIVKYPTKSKEYNEYVHEEYYQE